MRTLSLKIPETLFASLETLAERRGVSRSELIRKALMELFDREQKTPRGSALHLLEDLAGSVSGPEDLSLNKAYLDGLGR